MGLNMIDGNLISKALRTSIGIEEVRLCHNMSEYAREHNYPCVTANQFGINKSLAIVNNKAYANPVAGYITEKQEILHIDCPSYPNKKVRLHIVPLKIGAVEVIGDTPIEIIPENENLVYWNFVVSMLNNELEIVDKDYLTYHRKEKKRGPNDRCERCGCKYKKCKCK